MGTSNSGRVEKGIELHDVIRSDARMAELRDLCPFELLIVDERQEQVYADVQTAGNRLDARAFSIAGNVRKEEVISDAETLQSGERLVAIILADD